MSFFADALKREVESQANRIDELSAHVERLRGALLQRSYGDDQTKCDGCGEYDGDHMDDCFIKDALAATPAQSLDRIVAKAEDEVWGMLIDYARENQKDNNLDFLKLVHWIESKVAQAKAGGNDE